MLAKYGQYIFAEIRHAKRMHRLITEQLARDYESAKLRQLQASPVVGADKPDDAIENVGDVDGIGAGEDFKAAS